MLTISRDIVGPSQNPLLDSRGSETEWLYRAATARDRWVIDCARGIHVGGFVYLERLFAISLWALILLPPNGFSQAAPTPPQGASAPATQSGGLKINVLQGEGAKNNLRTRSSTAPVVEVRD